MRIRFLLVLVTLGILRTTVVYAQPALTEREKVDLVSAVEDEIYDYSLQHNFRSIGTAISPETFQIPLFVTTHSHGGTFYVIYRLMPFGEMYRQITIRSDEMALLFRNPRSGFPPDAPAMQTEYYDDDTICRDKHDATRLYFVVEMSPSPQRIREAIERQKKRYGFSNLEEVMNKKRPPHRPTP